MGKAVCDGQHSAAHMHPGEREQQATPGREKKDGPSPVPGLDALPQVDCRHRISRTLHNATLCALHREKPTHGFHSRKEGYVSTTLQVTHYTACLALRGFEQAVLIFQTRREVGHASCLHLGKA